MRKALRCLFGQERGAAPSYEERLCDRMGRTAFDLELYWCTEVHRFAAANQPSEGAPTGQTSAQAPHSMQVSASITYFVSPSDIASTGQSPAQAPQEMHSSEIIYAILILLVLRDEEAFSSCAHFLNLLYHIVG